MQQLRYCHSSVPLRPSWVIGRIMTRGRPFFLSHTQQRNRNGYPEQARHHLGKS